MKKSILVTGGAGFIGSDFVSMQVDQGNKVIVLDKLTYAGKRENLSGLDGDLCQLIVGDINDEKVVTSIFEQNSIDFVVNFAAESHVDNSIENSDDFIITNINGTHNLLKCSLNYWQSLQGDKKHDFRFLHVSTDEVFGSLNVGDKRFNENSNYNPSSPYSASKAASDHLVKAWFATYNLPVIITNCSNNYGSRQLEEKLIPFMIKRALAGQKMTIYGDGKNIRDWIYVGDHNYGVDLALKKGRIGQSYCFGGDCELSNNEIVALICDILDKKRPLGDGKSYKDQIIYVKDRKGHDFRYAIDCQKAKDELGFEIRNDFKENFEKVVDYYLSIF